ncbi:amino acid adenylation domain-containing protein, partial [Aquimarina litoralis]|uniref:amino acid adenylation domain-containing protein n=1 Tax=Aquimarina litoralis TaxID=584605 RepID=UPI0031CE7D66
MIKEAKKILSELKEENIKLVLNDNNIEIVSYQNKISSDLIQEIKSNKNIIIDYLKQNNKDNLLQSIPSVEESENYPLSSAQRRLWILSQFKDTSVVYNMPSHIQLNGSYDIQCFKRAIHSVIDRHEILRTVFREDENGEIKQWILKNNELDFTIGYKDLREEENKNDSINAYINEDSNKPFDLENGPLLRACLLQVSDENYVFYYNMHHIICDGWSMDVMIKDTLAYYTAYSEGVEPSLQELRIQYKDYASWESTQLETEEANQHKTYWLNQLSGELPFLSLPSQKMRPREKTYNGHSLRTFIPIETSNLLKNFTQKEGGSLFMGTLASLNVLFHKYSSEQDIIIGSPVAGRGHFDLDDQIGFYINLLTMRNQVSGDECFRTFFNKVKDTTLNAYKHETYPFDALIEDLGLKHDLSGNSLFNILLDFHSSEQKIESFELKGNQMNLISDLGEGQVKFDMEFHFEEIGEYLSLKVNYNTDIYEKEMVEELIMNYKELLSKLLISTDEKIGTLDYLQNKEKHQLLYEFNDTGTTYSEDKTVIDLFLEQVQNAPDNIALVFEDKEFTYKELDDKSNQLAHCLRQDYNIEQEDIVGIQLDRSDWVMVSILGILKAGAAYVPIIPELPVARKHHIVQDTQLKLLISETNYMFDLEYFDGDTFAVDVEFEPSEFSSEPVELSLDPSTLAYIIYTSGSTGKPKGVMIEHRSLVNYLNWCNDYYIKDNLSNSDFGLFTSLSFDLTITSLFLPLTNGSKLNIIKPGSNISEILKKYFESDLSCIKLTPAHISLLSELDIKDSKLELAIVGGEALQQNHVEILRNINPSIKIYNEYGPTESTVGCIVYEIPFSNSDILIGKPISNTQVYIVDDNLQLVPKGVVGELCLGGDGLSRGYLNREGLTREKFIDHPFKEGERLYRSGDLARWLSDGSIAFMGRKDDQVKIRGHRIELGEIEEVLLSRSWITQAVVVVQDFDGDKSLVSYVVSEGDLDKKALRSGLSKELPDYMVPGYYVSMDSLPLTSNGKVDRRSLPEVLESDLIKEEYVAPRSTEESVLVTVWESVLKRSPISVKDNFYNLGGDSIKSIQVASRLKQQGYRLKVEHILRNPILEDLAPYVVLDTRVIDQSAVEGKVLLTPIQQYFFEDPAIRVPHHFNQSVLLSSTDRIDGVILERSISSLVSHHDALRMVYSQGDGFWLQENRDVSDSAYSIDFYDLSKEEDALATMSRLGSELQSSIDLSSGPLFKVGHFRLADGDRLALIIHHLVVDGVSWRILLEDLSALYSGYISDKAVVLPKKTDSFQRWSTLQQEYAQELTDSKERLYWDGVCSSSITDFPIDKGTREDVVQFNKRQSFVLDDSLTELLQTRVHGVYNTEINDVLLTGLGLALRDVFGLDRSVLKMEGHGREEVISDVDISRTVGWFTSIYPFVLDVSTTEKRSDSLVQVKES